MRVLRPFLYGRLNRLFGEVKVTNEGMDCQALVVSSVMSRSGKKLDLEEWGETYVVSCPFCGDTRQRLYVNHRWGLYDERTDSRNWWMVKCFNEDCLADYARRMQLSGRIWHGDDQLFKAEDRLLKAAVSGAWARSPEYPGPLTPVGDLVAGHPARAYLEARGFEVGLLSSLYHVSYCPEASLKYPLATNRIIIPVLEQGKLLGWQARYLGERPSWRGVPKYYTMPGFKKSRSLYGLELAVGKPYVVLVEGPVDAWRFGPGAVAAFGKDVSPVQADLIARHFDTAVVLLDGEAKEESVKAAGFLAKKVRRVVRVQLRAGCDPGGLGHEELRAITENAVSRVS